MIFIRGDYQINTDKDKLQIEVIHRYLTESAYWATGRTLK